MVGITNWAISILVVALSFLLGGCHAPASTRKPSSAGCEQSSQSWRPPWALRFDALAREGFRNAAGLLVAWRLGYQDLHVGDDLSMKTFVVSREWSCRGGDERDHGPKRILVAFALRASGPAQPPEIKRLAYPDDLVEVCNAISQLAKDAATEGQDDSVSPLACYLVPTAGNGGSPVKVILSIQQLAAAPAQAVVRCVAVEDVDEQERPYIVSAEQPVPGGPTTSPSNEPGQAGQQRR